MKVTIEFEDDDGVDAATDAVEALRVHEYKRVLYAMQDELRRAWKNDALGNEAVDTVDELRRFFTEEVGCLLDD